MCPNRSGSVSTDLIIDFVAGGLGAAASVIVGQPLDTVKVRYVVMSGNMGMMKI